jgi:outer membrane immunogenic protein
MKKLAATATVAALSFMATSAQADWSGFYVTGHVDAGWGKADWAGFDGAEGGGEGSIEARSLPAPTGYANTTLFGDSDRDSGWGGGVGLGYNFQFDSIVLGAVVDWTWLDIGDSRNFTGCCGPNSVSSDISNVGTVRGVFGVAAGRVMPYVTAGWAWGDVNHTFRSSAGNGHRIDLGSDDGWTAGGGINVAIAENTALSLEVLYVDFGENSGYSSDTFPSEAAAAVESHATIARLGIIIRL